MTQQVSQKKQQELQQQYEIYKNGLQQIASKIGDVETEAEEHSLRTVGSVSGTAPMSRFPLRRKKAIISSKLTAGNAMLTALVHRLVLDTLEPLPVDRKCFRMINGVLVERTVKDVVPALKTNSEGLKKVLEELMKQYRSKQSEMETWKKKHNIQGKFYLFLQHVLRLVLRFVLRFVLSAAPPYPRTHTNLRIVVSQ
ncbi:putative prefoldin subunit [Lachnellula subtilissima]|uniref:Putative prefoldin subunit n=1 Tax=Lachnellula subtilissima TaxID=602034 RepID=A0A8H8UEK1_9HELO|nr:putative prefoldin subunit [Lachnellula subtilissima]